MSIQNEIDRISMNISVAYNAIREKGAEIPEKENSDNLASAIRGIPSGSGETTAYLVRSPVGTIVIWSGTVNNIPSGWHICDGTNGTPDLRDKFVLGAGLNYQPKDEGGEEEVTLSINQMPKHNHSIASGYRYYTTAFETNVQQGTACLANGKDSNTYNYTGSFLANTGSSQPHNNIPPYYALCYIMKIEPDKTDESTVNWEDINGRPDLSKVSVLSTMKVILSKELWDEEKQQTVNVPGISADFYAQEIAVVPDKEYKDRYRNAGITCEEQGENSLTFRAKTIPEEDIVMAIGINEKQKEVE